MYNNTNIIVVIIPDGHDLDKASMTNFEIQAFNRKLNKIAKLFRHVPILETDSNRKYFTRHGMHLYNVSKEWLSKLTATQIWKLVQNNRGKPVIILNWKGESIDEQKTVDVHTIVEVSSTQNNNSQESVTDKEITVRTTSD
jgi:hypothetical protein